MTHVHILYHCFALFIMCLPAVANAQVVGIIYHPEEPPKEYLQNFHSTAIKPHGAYGLASFEVNPWLYDLRTQTAYRFMETTGDQALVAVFKDYMMFSGNHTLQLQTSVSADEYLRIVDVLKIDNQYILVYSVRDQRTSENTIYIQALGPDLMLKQRPEKVLTLSNFAKDDIVLTRVAGNQNYIAFIHGDPDYTLNKNHCKPACVVFDRHFRPVWRQRFDFSLYEGLLADIELDNAGNLHVLRGASGHIIQPVAHSYFWKTDSTVTTVLGNPDQLNFGCKLRIIHGVATAVGLYKENRRIGYFIYKSDTATNAVSLSDRVPLPDQYNLSRNLVIREMVGLPSGDLVFSAEWDMCTVNGSHTYCSSGPVTVVSWNGGHRWQYTLYKDQTSNERSRGYTMIPWQNTVLFLYNDHPDNILRAVDDADVVRYHGTNSIAMVQKVDADGHATKEIVTLPWGTSHHRLVASGLPPIIAGSLYKVKILEGDKELNGVLEITP